MKSDWVKWLIKTGVGALGLSFFVSLSLALEMQGDFVQGGLLIGQLKQRESVKYNNRELPIDPQGRFIIALDRDHPATLDVEVVQDQRVQYHQFEIASRAYNIQKIEGVKRQYVHPNPSQVERAQREAQQVRAARNTVNNQSDFFNGFIWPVTGPITGVFGSQRVYNGVPKRPHYGVDIARPVGTPVVAPAAGVVTLAEPDLYYSGGTVIIDHGHGLSSTFLHLSTLYVEVGDRLAQGERVAAVGDTGRVTGAHLDWRMNWTAGGRDVRFDPQLLVPPMSD